MKVILISIAVILLAAGSAYAETYEIRAQDAVKTENTASGAPDGYGDISKRSSSNTNGI